MMMEKTFRVFRKGWGGFLICALILLAFLVGSEYDIFGYEHRIPSVESIESIIVPSIKTGIDTPEGIEKVRELHASLIEHKSEYENEDRPGGAYLNIKYLLKDGGILNRSYEIPDLGNAVSEGDLVLYDDVVNSKEAIISRLTPSIPVTEKTVVYTMVDYYGRGEGDKDADYRSVELTAKQAVGLYAAIMKDAANRNIGKTEYRSRYNTAPVEYIGYITIELRDTKNLSAQDRDVGIIHEAASENYESVYVEIMSTSEYTLAYLKTLGIETQVE